MGWGGASENLVKLSANMVSILSVFVFVELGHSFHQLIRGVPRTRRGGEFQMQLQLSLCREYN